MAPTIMIDDEVHTWLNNQRRVPGDNLNSVLRRIARFDNDFVARPNNVIRRPAADAGRSSGRLGLTGSQLNKEWAVGARHALFHRDGTWYENLERFPGALFEPDGYVLFKTKKDYESSPYISIGAKTNIPKGISSIPGYIRK
jgi:hypothetical protein